MSQKFSFTLTEATYLEANRLDFWITAKSSKFLKIEGSLLLLGLAVALIFTIVFADQPTVQKPFLGASIVLAVWSLMTVLAYCGKYFLLPRRTRKLFSQQMLFHDAQTIEVRPDALEVTSKLSNVKLPYHMVLKWAENAKVFLIYTADETCHILPKGSSAIAAIDQLRGNLVESGRPGQIFD